MAYDIAQTDKLSVFMDDMRRSGVVCLPPCVNRSEADFAVEPHGDGHAVRYALGALKGVGEKAMEALVAERAREPYKSLADFASRIDPKAMNKRQLESLVAAGALDGLDANRAGVHALVETMLASAAATAAARESQQGGLFGDAVELTLAVFAPSKNGGWNLAQTMAQEKEAFGFFFSGHPIDQWQHVLDAQGARTYAATCQDGGPAGGGRTSCVLAGIIEEAKWRTPQNGNGRSSRYLLISLTDSGGSFMASCFDEDVQPTIEQAARSGEAVLIQAELLWRPGEDTPRVTIRGLSPLSALAKRLRSRLTLDLDTVDAIDGLATLLDLSRGGRSEVHVRVPVAGGRFAQLSLGREFAIDAEIQVELARMPGVRQAALRAIEGARHLA
jgi:DNA polymerase-3 subunit alpha